MKQQKIILIRHAKPDFLFNSKHNYKTAKKALEAFNESNIKIVDNEKLVKINNKINSTSKIYCSHLRRSIETAKLLVSEEASLKKNKVFNEFDLYFPRFPWIKLSFNAWVVISRLIWLLGLRNDSNVETFESAKKRSKQAANILTESCTSEKEVVLIGHGLLNRFIGKTLLENSWELNEKSGRKYLDFNIYIK
jgi:broad specificity phosphatase PhoE